ncbi:MAG TPA: cbb3-type cytochrome c oxidase subunit I [Solirubrobacterales bacterium]|jgi:cytochrome c oxidase subunit 1|nr:cbb3-type cytochrome c oxidase subunit I [Solirubrobacterales bacterium]
MSGATAVLRNGSASIVDALTGTDHKRIGLATTATAFAFFLIGGSLALLMRSELASPGMDIVSEGTYNELFTIHGSTMFFLFAAPAAVAIGVYMVPLQLGASGIAWPRLALLGYWLLAAGGVIMYAGFLTAHGAATFGWTAYYPLSDSNETPGMGADFWIVAVVLATTAVLLQAVCVLATIVRRRAPGMSLLRMPLFAWSEVVTCFMVVASFPVLIVTMILLFLDRQGVGIFTGSGGAVTYQHLFWFYGHPVVYVVFFPLVGVVGEVIATFSRRRFFGFKPTVLSLLVFSAISMSVWAHHMFTTQAVANNYFSTTSTLLLVPAGIEYFAFLATMVGGRIRLGAPMLFALGFVLLFLIGGLTGIFIGSPPLDYNVHDTYFVVAHFHYTVFGGTVFGLFAAIYYWFPKLTGRMLDERLGRLHAVLMFVGALVTFIPMFFLGVDGMSRRVADYLPTDGLTTLNVVATVGAFTIFVSVVVFLVNVVRSLRLGEPAGPDPWKGQTLEWFADSPPPAGNFASLPPVRSHAPLLDLREDGVDPAALRRRASIPDRATVGGAS